MIWWRRGVPLDEARWTVVDTETSGLDAARDRLLSVGAVDVRGGRVRPDASFHCTIRQDLASAPENIALHGIGGDAQRGGDPAARALPAFSAFLHDGIPVAFNAAFDHQVLRNVMRPLGLRLQSRWLDLALLAPALEPGRAPGRRSLDDWLELWGIRASPRHDALADALATAELFLALREKALRQGCRTDRDLFRLADAARWLPGASARRAS